MDETDPAKSFCCCFSVLTSQNSWTGCFSKRPSWSFSSSWWDVWGCLFLKQLLMNLCPPSTIWCNLNPAPQPRLLLECSMQQRSLSTWVISIQQALEGNHLSRELFQRRFSSDGCFLTGKSNIAPFCLSVWVLGKCQAEVFVSILQSCQLTPAENVLHIYLFQPTEEIAT